MLRVSPEPINAAGIVMDITIALARYNYSMSRQYTLLHHRFSLDDDHSYLEHQSSHASCFYFHGLNFVATVEATDRAAAVAAVGAT
jgi:hypothetical protein